MSWNLLPGEEVRDRTGHRSALIVKVFDKLRNQVYQVPGDPCKGRYSNTVCWTKVNVIPHILPNTRKVRDNFYPVLGQCFCRSYTRNH